MAWRVSEGWQDQARPSPAWREHRGDAGVAVGSMEGGKQSTHKGLVWQQVNLVNGVYLRGIWLLSSGGSFQWPSGMFDGAGCFGVCGSKGDKFCSLLVRGQPRHHVSHRSVSHHVCLQVGRWPITGYTYRLRGNMVYYCSASCKSLFLILCCVQRDNLDEFISGYDLGDISSSASSALYLILITTIILPPFVFHSALI